MLQEDHTDQRQSYTTVIKSNTLQMTLRTRHWCGKRQWRGKYWSLSCRKGPRLNRYKQHTDSRITDWTWLLSQV